MSWAAKATDYDVQVVERDSYSPLRQPQLTKRHELRVLGVGEDDEGYGAPPPPYRRAEELLATIPPPREEGIDPTPYLRDPIQSRPYSAPLPAYEYGREDAYYQDTWDHGSLATNTHLSLRNRLGLPGKRLPLFLILSLMAVGLIVAITPVFAKSAKTYRTGMSLSGYMDGSTTQQIEGETVPVIDASTNPQVAPQDPNPKSKIQNPKSAEVVGAPSISVNKIEEVLKQYGSPAAGKGQALYDLGVKYGINPAYALAFFVHESGCGTKGVARFTKSLGNIRTTPGYADYEGYRSYPTWESGMDDWYKLISGLYVGEWGLRTLDAIIPVYAPWGDNNNPPSYIASVKGMVDSWRGK